MTEQEGTSRKGVRGKGKLLFLENIAEGEQIPVENFTSQPSGEHRSDLAHYIGRIARDGHMLPLSVSNWKYMLPIHIQRAMDDIKYVFDYPEELDHCIRRKLNEYWRDHKHTMKLAGYDPNRSEAQNLANRPADVVESQWPPLVKMWNTKKNKELAAQNKQNRSKQTVQHTGGSKPHMEYAREMLAETGRFPERHEIFRRTRTKKRKTADPSELVMDPVAAEQYDRMVEIRNKANQPGSGVVLSGRNDAFAAVMGPDRRGRVRCFGSTVKPKQIWGESSSSSKVIQLTEENAMLKQRVAELEAQVAALPTNQNNEGLEEM